MSLDATFTIIYAVLGSVLVGVELVAVWRRRRGDTISEHWWFVQARHPVAARVVLAGFLGWLAWHLLAG